MFDPAFLDDRAPLAALLFKPGMRPQLDGIATVAQTSGFTLVESARQVTKREGHASIEVLQSIELLRNGLTFDLAGLSPGQAARYPIIPHRHDLPSHLDPGALEAITLLPGPHLAGGQRMLPGVRVAAALLTELARCPGLVALSWLPSGTCVSPRWFTQSVTDWLAGGLFPALPLVSLVRQPDGSIVSQGLQWITGRDFRLDCRAGTLAPTHGQDMKHAARVADWLVRQDPFNAACTPAISGAGPVRFSIDRDGSLAAVLEPAEQ